MRRRILAAFITTAAAVAAPVIAASPASANGKSSIYNCWNRSITSNKHSMSVTCNPPGKQYRFEVYCGWYSAGKGGAYWKSSPWTKDGTRATATCGAAYVAGVGRTVYYR